MAYITKRGSSYGVRYTYQDEQGKNCNKWESFSTKEEAINRKKQIEHELANGTFLIPSTITVKEFLMEWLPKQCNKHKWAPCTYQSNLGTVQNLIIPYIGDMQMQKLKPYHLEDLYATLSKTPCGQYYEGKKQVLSEKQQQRFLSGTTIHEVHRLLRTAFQYAVEWGILVKSPVPVDSPKKSIQERAIWDADEMWAALASMEDPILHLAVHLTLVGALREGEVAGLTPEDLDFEGADGTGTFRINKCMQRVKKASLAKTGKGCILQEFEDKREGSTTTLVLKKTKTASSNRTIFMTAVLKEELKHWLKRLEMDEAVDPELTTAQSKYLESLARAGAEVHWVELSDPDAAVAEALTCDGLLLPGGGDMDPAFYGQERIPACGEPNLLRDAAEPKLLQAFLAADRPVLGICRGIQVMNAVLGGTLYQDIKPFEHVPHNDHWAKVHTVTVRRGTLLSRLLRQDTVLVNSQHHQAADRTAPGLEVAALSEDGIVEALEKPDARFCLGVQWHPEWLSDADPAQQGLFDAFVEACRG